MIKPKQNNSGQLEYPNLHDAELVMIRNQDGSTTMEFNLISKENLIVVFKNVVNIKCNDFWGDNIVLDFTVETRCEVATHRLERVFIRPSAMLERYHALIEKTLNKIRQGELCFIQIIPSCGCEAFILCHSVEFYRKETLDRIASQSGVKPS
jgi:hypothetical protein